MLVGSQYVHKLCETGSDQAMDEAIFIETLKGNTTISGTFISAKQKTLIEAYCLRHSLNLNQYFLDKDINTYINGKRPKKYNICW